MCICVLLYLCIVYFHSGCRNIDLHGWSGSYCASWSPAIEKDLSIQICHTLAYLYLYIFHRGPTSTYSGLHSIQICRFYDRHWHTYSLKGSKAHSVIQTEMFIGFIYKEKCFLEFNVNVEPFVTSSLLLSSIYQRHHWDEDDTNRVG